MQDRFLLNSEQCETLLAFESSGSLQILAKTLGKDVSVVSRQLQKIAQIAPVLEKQNGRWQLSHIGKSINNWTREAMAFQNRVLAQRSIIRIATTREFAARVLAPQINKLKLKGDRTLISILSCEDGVESALLSGNADIGIDCGRPEDPLLKFSLVKSESFSVFAAPAFIRKHNIQKKEDLLSLPHLQYIRASSAALLNLTSDQLDISTSSNDIAVIRAACVEGLGWCVLPNYTVGLELQNKQLQKINSWKISNNQFGVWWPRTRTTIEPWVERCCRWLKQQNLN